MRLGSLLILVVCAGSVLLGCSKSEDLSQTAGDQQPDLQATAPSAAQQTSPTPAGGGVQPMTATPIPNAPVAGTEGLQGSGGGTGQAAKDMARRAANQAGGTPQATEDE